MVLLQRAGVGGLLQPLGTSLPQASCTLLLLLLLLALALPASLVHAQTDADDTNTLPMDPIYYERSNHSGWGWNGSCPIVVPKPPSESGNAALAAVFGEWMGAWAGFLFITIAASQCALLVKVVSLPLITGYMFFGVLVGPQILDMVSKTDIKHLQPITQFALAFISMSAGAELYLPELRALFRRIITITSAVTVICFTVCMLVIFGLAKAGLIPFMTSLSGTCQFSIALIAASIMVTQSPASAIAVVAETKSKGPFTSTMLGITVLTDIVVLLLYSICAAVANANCSPDANGFKVLDLFVTIGCVLAAGVLGYLFGKLTIFLLWIPRIHGEWAVLPLGYAVFKVSSWFTEWSTEEWGHGVNFDPLLICICAGYVVANHSRNRRKFLRFMGSCGPIIFIPFFTLTGAGLNLRVMGESAPFAFIVFSVRAATFAAGSALGGYYTGMDPLHMRTLWISMLTQAGVSLGIAAETAIAFPSWGPSFQSTMVSVILINQVVGPVLCKWALRKNGEDGMAVGSEEEDDEDHHKRAMIIGINISSLAVAQRLLKHDWNVLFIDTDARKTDMLQWIQYEKRKKRERTPAEMKKRAAMLAAKAERARAAAAAAAGRNTFVDLAPPGGGPPVVVHGGDVEPSVSRLDDVGEEHSVGEGHAGDESAYQPVDDQQVQVAVSSSDQDRPPSPSRMDPADAAARDGTGGGGSLGLAPPSAASAAGAPAGVAFTDDALLNTTTPVVEQQLQFLHLTPLHADDFLVEDVRLANKDPHAQLHHGPLALGLKALTAECNSRNVDAALVMLESDELNFDLCTVLQESLHLKRVIAEMQNPNWTSQFASVGVLTLFPYSLASHTLAQMVMTGEHQALELVSPSRPLHVSLSHVIRPDTIVDNPPLYLRHLSPEDQRAFIQQHPDPIQPREAMWQFNEKLRTVTTAAREEYISQLHALHANNSIALDNRGALSALESTFSGPGMMSLDSVEAEDEEEKREQEIRRQLSTSSRARERKRRESRVAEDLERDAM